MPVDDLWYLGKRGPDGKRLPSKRHGRGKRWRARYVDDTGQPKQKLFERRADAEQFDVNTRADVSRGQYVAPAAGKVTVMAYGEQWRKHQLHRDATAARIEMTLRVHVEPILGRMQLAQVRPSHIQAWVKDRATVLAPSSLRVVYHVLVGMFDAATRDRMIGRSPCVGIRLPEIERVERFIPTPDQVHALADAFSVKPDPGKPSRERYQALVYVAAGSGLRQGEAWGLELEHVDFPRREIRIVQQLVTPAGKSPRLAPPKTATSRRTVEMGQVVAEALARHIELFPPVDVEILDETNPRKPVTRQAKLLFTSGRGNPMQRTGWAYPWKKAVEAVDEVPEGFGYHGLRHYFATLLIHGGASVKTVQMALGHATPIITLNTYAGEWPEAIDRTRNLVDAALSGARLAGSR
ncbi:Site-specific recombinase XerD [Micromonospora echinofusca]|uniref:Site-specific recombinase XerD n=1 Tax=Micromonospora echinofusca TaxID=47858 RepID=A0A1C5G2X7_MICEH|nr:site-specific integrase [Micromonospora echinofusca]SCG14010.1 Site-specific recombinase XerD [Micromonospora echinofusca]